jgi:phenylalanine-4-hydroxylase
VCREEGGELRVYGAGLLSGSQELQYCITDQPEHRDFDINAAIVTKYPESGLQPLYFVTESLDDMKNKMM